MMEAPQPLTTRLLRDGDTKEEFRCGHSDELCNLNAKGVFATIFTCLILGPASVFCLCVPDFKRKVLFRWNGHEWVNTGQPCRSGQPL